MNSRRHTIQSVHYIALALVGMAALFSAIGSLVAGPVTGGATGPTTKITVYQGTMSITPGRGSSDTLEIGNPGTSGVEITSTGKVYFRPSGIAFDHGAWFDATSSKTDLYVTGKLYINGAAVPPWPIGSGISYWQQTASALLPLPQGTTPRGLKLTQPITDGNLENKSALAAIGSSTTSTLYIANSSGPAMTVTGDVLWNGNLTTNSTNSLPVSVNGLKFWYPGNEGIGSGLDADMIDGVKLYFVFTNGTGVEIGSTRTFNDGSRSCNSISATCLCSGDANGCLTFTPAL